jgi:hypothetical protein
MERTEETVGVAYFKDVLSYIQLEELLRQYPSYVLDLVPSDHRLTVLLASKLLTSLPVGIQHH